VSDARRRDLERRARETGSPADEAALLVERVRAGELTRARVELAACCGHAGAVHAVGGEPGALEELLTRVEAFGPLEYAAALLAIARELARDATDLAPLLDETARALSGDLAASTAADTAFERYSDTPEDDPVRCATVHVACAPAFAADGRARLDVYSRSVSSAIEALLPASVPRARAALAAWALA
jgi:hypothetical protein